MPRRPTHFKRFTTVANHRKMPAYADNDLFALWCRLGIAAIERFADRTGDSFVLHESELLTLTGKKRSDSARRVLHYLATSSPVSFEYCDSIYRIHFPNLAEKHGFKQQNGMGTGPYADADADADASSPPMVPLRPRRSDKPGPRKPAGERGTLFPEAGLSEEQKRQLAASPSLSDITPAQFRHACQIVADWSHANGKRRIDWVKATRNAIARGWALEGMPGVPKFAPARSGNGAGPTPRNRHLDEEDAALEAGELKRVSEMTDAEREEAAARAAEVKRKLPIQAAQDRAGDDLSESRPNGAGEGANV